jgi:ATP-dependent helicase/nuclease subunit A
LRELPPVTMQVDGDGPADKAEVVDATAALLGQAVHRVLQWATEPAAAGSDLDRLAHAALQEIRAVSISPERVVSVARAILDSPACQPFFDPSTLAWAGNEVVVCDGDQLLRIDRLIARRPPAAGAGNSEQWWVLDYKLSHEPQGLGPYRVQLRRYRDLVRAMQPQANVRAAFITGRGELIEPDLEAAGDI